MKKSMRLALISMKHEYIDPHAPEDKKRGDLAFNLERHRYWIAKALERDPDFIGFPEFSLTGWVVNPTEALSLRSPAVREFESWARRHRVFLSTCFVEKRGQKLYNTCLIAGPRGRVGVMRKINLIHGEARSYEPGRDFPIFDVAGCRMGVTTCADSSYYEMMRILSLRGAEVIFAPSANTISKLGNNRNAWIKWRRESWTPMAKGACVFVAGVSCAGLCAHRRRGEEENRFCSGALVLDWTGKLTAKLSGPNKREGMLVADLDLAGLRQARTKFLNTSFRPAIVYNRRAGWVGGLV